MVPVEGARAFDAFAWEKRPVLVFARSGEDAHYRSQLAALEKRAQEAADRDMVVVGVAGNRVSVVAGDGTLRRGAHELRAAFGIGRRDFAVILVGKDTTEKLRSFEPTDWQRIFDLIDTMPMRRREIEERGR